MKRYGIYLGAALPFIPVSASAHLVSSGLGPVYDGIYHFVLSPEQFLPIMALALFAGRRGPIFARWVLFVVPLAWAAASFVGAYPWAGLEQLLVAVSFLLAGGLLAADWKLSPPLVVVVAVALGLCCGAAYRMSAEPDPPGYLAMVGGAGSIFVLLALTASAALPLRRMWTVVAIRVAGSWTAAIGLLLVGWWVHGHG